MTRRCKRLIQAVTMLVVIGAAGNSQAQDMRRDSKSDGVLLGAGTGAAAGTVISLVTEEICSPAVCAYLGGVAGALIGLVVDKHVGDKRPITPGMLIDDGLGNGALIGALGGAGLVLADASINCGRSPDRGPCTRNGVLLDMLFSARWMTIVGLLVDAAIPSRAPGAGSQRRRAVSVSLRF
jgi:hypothetical protein